MQNFLMRDTVRISMHFLRLRQERSAAPSHSWDLPRDNSLILGARKLQEIDKSPHSS